MQYKYRFQLLLLLVFCLSHILLQNRLAAQQETTKPLELPAFIIEGVEQHNIHSSIKQMPRKTSPLSSTDLDSLNTFEKIQPTLLPLDKLPTHYINKHYTEGFIKASYGLFNSPEVSGGYRFFADKFDIFATAGGAFSNGDALNSENNKLFLDIKTNYIADEKFFIFGGSNTHTNLFINTQNYNFYGYGQTTNSRETYPNKDYFDRNLTQLKFEVESDGYFENALFSVGGTGNYISANNSPKGNHLLQKDIQNYYARGFINIKNYWKNWFIGSSINLNFENLNQHSLNYYQIDASASYFNNIISIILKGGFQVANNFADNKENSKTGVLLQGNIEYRLNKSVTITAKASTGLVQTDFEDLITLNPYLSSRLNIDHRYDIINVYGSVWWHPNESVQLSAGLNWRTSDRNILFLHDTLAEFKLAYINGTVIDIFGEALWNITTKDRIISKVVLNANSPNDDYYFTYSPLLKLSSTYHKTLLDNLNAFATIEFRSQQETNINKKNNNTLDPYFIVNLGADITFKPINIFVKLNNILNTNYVVWEKYTERGFFAAVGIIWMF